MTLDQFWFVQETVGLQLSLLELFCHRVNKTTVSVDDERHEGLVALHYPR